MAINLFHRLHLFHNLVTTAGAAMIQETPPKKSRKTRRWCVRLIFRERYEKGHFHNLFRTTRASDPEQFFRYTRMTQNNFHKLCNLIRHRLINKNQSTSLKPRTTIGLNSTVSICINMYICG
ncbi:hypothetical protein ABEB36_004467 [Hypothenemus hampei]|uniref:Secreted protein n=1 Tax=Hypothenemus hampei TaxID=57062 RepID=A0ABD1F3E1_HYPHA